MSRRLAACAADLRDGLRAQPGRMALVLLAIAVGTVALTVLLAVLGGLRGQARRLIQDLGVNVFAVSSPSGGTAGAAALTEADAALLRQQLEGCTVSAVRLLPASTRDRAGAGQEAAVDPFYLEARQGRLVEGRFLDAEDLRLRARVAVIDARLAAAGRGRLGGSITLRDQPYRIVGVADFGGGQSLDESDTVRAGGLARPSVWTPLTTPPYGRLERPDRALSVLYVRTASGASFESSVQRARLLLERPGRAADALAWLTPEVLLQRLRAVQETIRMTVGSIALLCLLLGGVTLMSLMVANVRDRVGEIGLRRALGATPGAIGFLFMAEALVVTLTGALLGAGATQLVLHAGRSRWPVPVDLGAYTLWVPVLLAGLLGVLFSWGPARMAARLAPAEALRQP